MRWNWTCRKPWLPPISFVRSSTTYDIYLTISLFESAIPRLSRGGATQCQLGEDECVALVSVCFLIRGQLLAVSVFFLYAPFFPFHVVDVRWGLKKIREKRRVHPGFLELEVWSCQMHVPKKKEKQKACQKKTPQSEKVRKGKRNEVVFPTWFIQDTVYKLLFRFEPFFSAAPLPPRFLALTQKKRDVKQNKKG